MGSRKKKNKNKAHPLKDQIPDTTPGVNSSVSARNLRKQDLGAVIFGCRSHTVQECLSNLLFGLPATHFPYVKKIEPGLPLFLFNYNDRMLHGIYEAAGHGMMNINPYAWTSNDGDVTGYPAQVKVRVRKPCKSLKEEQIKCILHQNYFDPKDKRRFWHELDHTQTGHLLSLFESQSLLYSSPPLKPPKHKSNDSPVLKHDARNEDKYSRAPRNWASLFKENFSTKGQKEDEHLVSEPNWDEENRVCLSKPSRSSDPSGVIEHWEEERQLSDVGHCLEEDVLWEAETRESNIKPLWGEEVGPSGSSPCWKEAQPTPITTKWDEELQIAETQSRKGANEDEEFISYKGLDGEGSIQKLQSGDVFVPLAIPYVKDVCYPAALPTAEKKDSNSEEHTEDAFYPCATHFEVEGSLLGPSTSKKKYSNLEEDMKASRSTSEKYEDALISSSDIRPIVDKMRQELKAAKVYSVDQHRKAVALERELAESGILLQHLRHRVMLLESHLQDSSKAGTQRCNNPCNNKQFIESYDEHLEGSNELLYIMGGYDGESWLQTMDCYSPSSDMLKSLKSMSSVRSHTSAALLNGLIYIYGGWNCNGKSRVWYDTVECYNPWSNKWISCPPLSQKKGCLAGASVNNKIYAIGGGNGKDCFNEVEMFDPVLERWIPMQSMLQKRFASAAVEFDGIIYVAGGYDGTNYLTSAERFDPREGYWSKLPTMNLNRGSHSSTVLKGKLYALGGYDGNKYVPSVEVFDPCMGSWLEGEKMKQPRGSFAAPVIGGTIFAIGGHAEGNKIVDSVETYRIGHGWSVTKLKGIGKRCFFSSVHY